MQPIADDIKEKFDDDFLVTTDTFHMGIHVLFGEHLARRFEGYSSVLDACAGAGFTSIPLSRKVKNVIAVNIDESHLALAKHNAAVAGRRNINFILGDVLGLLTKKALPPFDAAFLDPDWALPGVNKEIHTGKLADTGPRVSLLFEKILPLTQNIALRLPKETLLHELDALPPHELEENIMDGTLKFYLLYFGNLMKKKGKTSFAAR